MGKRRHTPSSSLNQQGVPPVPSFILENPQCHNASTVASLVVDSPEQRTDTERPGRILQDSWGDITHVLGAQLPSGCAWVCGGWETCAGKTFPRSPAQRFPEEMRNRGGVDRKE